MVMRYFLHSKLYRSTCVPSQTPLFSSFTALYLWAIGRDQPTGPYVRRRKFKENGEPNNYQPTCRERWWLMFRWMDWIMETQKVTIEHYRNSGREERVGSYFVDGIDHQNKTIYELNGCYHHGHCRYGATKIGQDRMKRTLERLEDLKKLKPDYTIVAEWECDIKREARANPDLQHFLNAGRPALFSRYGYKTLTKDIILNAVLTEDFFGMVEVDIRVPEQWQSPPPHNTQLSPAEYFSEMSPLFCTTDVPFECIGEHMQTYVREHGLSERPRRLLVGGMKAEKLLLASPLLRWYLQHGLIVTEIHEAVEFKPFPCFESFVHEITEARLKGDEKPEYAIQAATMKLIGE